MNILSRYCCIFVSLLQLIHLIINVPLNKLIDVKRHTTRKRYALKNKKAYVTYEA
jgi:hypothetical protein